MEPLRVACPSCGQENPTGQKFCGECATPLPVLCPACGALATATQKFCGTCAAPLQTAEVAAFPVGGGTPTLPASVVPPVAATPDERRLVTALFCDLVGFTPLSGELDPEEVRRIQAEYFGKMREQIERYGGVVEKYAGDAELA